MIQVYDRYGRPLYIAKQEWKSNVLLPNLESNRNDPDQLYNHLISAASDGFAEDVIPFAEHLFQTDPNPERSTVVLAIVYMDVKRLQDAEQTLQGFMAKHGETGIVLTNLAKVYSYRGDHERAETTLLRALELDPNQDNGLSWYASMQQERGGDEAVLDAYRHISKFPGSWRARLWVARAMLADQDIEGAQIVYEQAIEHGGTPLSADLLMQMSGDLGGQGYLREIIQWVAPHFRIEHHGIQVGNNLIKAHLELGQLAEAHKILEGLHAFQRPDWQETLRYWDTELAKADVAQKNSLPPNQPDFVLFGITGPIWAHEHDGVADLLPKRNTTAPKIAVIGGTVLYPEQPKAPQSQLPDAAGRLSRAIPLLLAETVQLNTASTCQTLVGYAQHFGFAVFGQQQDDSALCQLAASGTGTPDYVIGVTVNTAQTPWAIELRVLRYDGTVVEAELNTTIDQANPGPGVARLAGELTQRLASQQIVSPSSAPPWYHLPSEPYLSDYLLRLEQQLVVCCEANERLESGGMSGEREMLSGAIGLCLNEPHNDTTRLLLA